MIALAALLFVLPLFLVTAAAIRLDSRGPVIFRQQRGGLHGRAFTIYKFRTMRALDDGKTVEQAHKGDPRVTRVGRLLRKTSIDELPQLLNVLLGDMSLVGPRPHALAHDEYYGGLIPGYVTRFLAKPGLTGLAQVSGFRGETREVSEMADRIEQDLKYLRTWSLRLDLRIMARTALIVCRADAY